ncbi:MAG: ATP-binding cassette domain-containing protein [Planctomycetota bacterium]|nr:ATP-binding cassette domain-containing protein [Planctomycetota bacterium]
MTLDTNTNAPAIHAEALTKIFSDPERGKVAAVQDLDLACNYGEVMGLLGPNGAGKTTTLRMLSTILAPTRGRGTVAGADITNDPIGVRKRIGFLSGTTGLYPRLTAEEVLQYFGRLHGMDEDTLGQRLEVVVKAFDLKDFLSGRCESLSTGQKQRVSIARAVIHDPRVLILDEPTTGLDLLAASDMIRFVESRREEGRCVLFSTHILSEAERLCDRIAIVHAGRVLAVGTQEELREDTGEKWLEDVFRAFVARADHSPEQAADQPQANITGGEPHK